MERLYRFMLDKALKAGVEWAPGHLFQGLEFLRSSLVVEFRSEGFPRLVRSRFVIGADGASSGVARSLRLDRNEHLLVGSEEVYREARLGSEPSLHCFIDPILAPGYLGWLVAAGDEIRLGVAGHAGGFSPQQSLDVIKERARRACALDGVEEAFASGPLERRSGLIPVGGMLRRIAHHRGLLVGDAAGAPSPLTAGGLDPCLRRAPWVAEVVTGYLREGRENGLLAYSGASLRRRFLAKRLMRLGYSRLSSPLLAEVGLFALRAPLVNLAARAVFFGDVAPKWATSAFARVEAALPLALPDAGPSDGREGGERGEGGDQHE
jgi:flavin-dependent dehydrogenase